MSAAPFKYALGQRLALIVSGENGEAVARSEYDAAEPQYLVRYAGADGRAVEAWWSQSALEACNGKQLQPAGSPQSLTITVATASPGDMPTIGSFWDAQGGYFAGIARGVEGQPDHLLILAADKPPADVAWQPALDWAAALGAYGYRDWALPTRAESALLFANLRDQFEPQWHWTCEQYSRYYAWDQGFVDGGQDNVGKTYEGRARAVRRLVIQSFNHS